MLGRLRKGVMPMTQDERIEKLEKRVDRIEDHLKRAPIPYVDGMFAQLKDLQRRVEELEKKK
jgi:archaellum component FlaC